MMLLRRTLAGKPWTKYFGSVVGLHIIGIAFLLVTLPHHPAMLGLGVLAYTLGLRHAFDADHIVAIDNTVRKLIEQKRDPEGVGFYFSLGHSTVVLLLTIGVVVSMNWVKSNLPMMEQWGGVIGSTVSGLFLLLIGLINLFILVQMYRVFRQLKQMPGQEEKMEELLDSRGFIARLTGPLFKLVGRSWHIYFIGFLFGLGFDTASEIGLLAMSQNAASSSISWIGVLSLPILFASGMSLMDTADGVFMTSSYQWAFNKPIRKMYYNLTVTAMSVIAALFVAFVEIMQTSAEQFSLEGAFWSYMQNLDLGSVGYILVILFILTWSVSYGIWRVFRIEEKWG
ncbi:HoxN/HupN/NixA family nickel/cobalt transporter [Paenibacillus elgii]|uniref:Nickel/cobalt efflux system n=1 Tax=Paenibacillus elgii TaxID=189691 RepID=A0A2T6G1M1_9BACL|nr:HoxN/HupN/NixA family nickel/cobalt transporter [Paenibacillus elgii]PUA38025.1 HoxN/HupN/NixA family nickel/cobalt transporter [Paenibacillus elgii]